ncbi:MAG: glycosyltransferase [Rhodothermales bacterium]
MTAEDPGPLGIVGPYPPYRGGIAHFTERLHRAVENPDGTSSAAVRRVVGISFSRQYPGWLYPGSSQETPVTEGPPISTAEQAGASLSETSFHVSPDLPEARRDLDSLCPWTGRRAARHLRDAGVTEVVFMVWMPFFCPVYLSVLNGLQRGGVRSGAAAPSIRTTAIVHNAIPHEWQPFARPLMRRLLRRMDRVVALSAAVADDIAELGGRRRDEIEVRPHPVYNQFGEAVDKTAARKSLGLPPGRPEDLPEEGPEGRTGARPVILFFGLVRAYKGLDVLLEALARLPVDQRPEPHLVVAGEFYEDEATYREHAERLGLANRVHFHGRYISDEDVHTYFSAADIVVQPYRHATQSGVVQTAFQFGRPVIVTRVGGLPDMVQDGEDGLIAEPDDPASLADRLEHALRPDVLQRLTDGAGRTRNRAGNDWASFAELFASSGQDGPACT